jgi:hypothetical protein
MRSWLLAGLVVSGVAHAESPARALFDAAIDLTKAGNYAEACPKLEESQRLEPSRTTQIYLADCWEHIGRSASAFRLYVALGDKRAKALRSRLTRVVVHVGANAAGIEVKRDGAIVPASEWNVETPIDPGRHVFAATAPGATPWTSTVDVSGEGRTVTIDVPRFAAPAAAPPPLAPASTDSSQRIAGFIVTGVGASLTGLGGYLYVASSGDDCGSLCGADSVALPFAAAGLLTLGGGIVLIATSPSSKERGVRAAPGVGGLVVTGRF